MSTSPTNVTAPVESPDARSFMHFLLETCQVAMECGCSSNRVETLVGRLGESWGYEVEVAATPTAVWLAVRKEQLRMVEFTRVKSWRIDLDKLAGLSDLVDLIYDHKISVEEARHQLRVLSLQPNPYGQLLTILAGGGTSLGVVYFARGTMVELGLAFLLGVCVQALQKYLFGGENRRYLADFLCASFVALYCTMAHIVLPDLDVPKLIVGGLISLVPGLAFVNAVHEVAQKNLSSGSARLMEAIVVALSLAFGVVAVLGILQLLGVTT